MNLSLLREGRKGGQLELVHAAEIDWKGIIVQLGFLKGHLIRFIATSQLAILKLHFGRTQAPTEWWVSSSRHECHCSEFDSTKNHQILNRARLGNVKIVLFKRFQNVKTGKK